eukprot:4131079-Prymnesium_polylepis.1
MPSPVGSRSSSKPRVRCFLEPLALVCGCSVALRLLAFCAEAASTVHAHDMTLRLSRSPVCMQVSSPQLGQIGLIGGSRALLHSSVMNLRATACIPSCSPHSCQISGSMNSARFHRWLPPISLHCNTDSSSHFLANSIAVAASTPALALAKKRYRMLLTKSLTAASFASPERSASSFCR